jgi:integrase
LQNRIVAKASSGSSTPDRNTSEMERAAALPELDDWVFASKRHRGRKPFWGQAILRKFILPRAQELGIEKRFGWHTFRHTYSTLLRSVGTEFKVMQELLRNSSLRSTLDVSTQAITPSKHAAQEAVMSLVLSAGGTQRAA